MSPEHVESPAVPTHTAPSLGRRGAGVLVHLTSLPGAPYNGDLGPSAYRFADFLASAGQSWWQMLPVSPLGMGGSPYQSPSSFAGNPLLISLDKLAGEGLLAREDVAGPAGERVDYGAASVFREARLRKAFARFQARDEGVPAYDEFCRLNVHWLPDYALFQALKDGHGGRPWWEWEEPVRQRVAWALQEARGRLAADLAYHQFVQYLFDRQWRELHQYCADNGIGLIGDVPIFVARDSADVWARPELFQLDERGLPTAVAGVPPDYFSATGQLWGNPLYRWDVLAQRGYDWWIDRLRAAFARVDAVRLDHFIGFHNYWSVPAGDQTAAGGHWVPGPDAPFFSAVLAALGPVELIAEDLGVVTPAIKKLRDQFKLPGMRVLQFAFGNDPDAASHQPHNYPRRCVVYTGTHDNDTTMGWFGDAGGAASTRAADEIERERRHALAYLHSDGTEVHWDMIRAATASVADTCIVPMQDLLGLGTAARMNLPGTSEGNWEWRLADLPPASTAARLLALAGLYGRLVKPRETTT